MWLTHARRPPSRRNLDNSPSCSMPQSRAKIPFTSPVIPHDSVVHAATEKVSQSVRSNAPCRRSDISTGRRLHAEIVGLLRRLCVGETLRTEEPPDFSLRNSDFEAPQRTVRSHLRAPATNQMSLPNIPSGAGSCPYSRKTFPRTFPKNRCLKCPSH